MYVTGYTISLDFPTTNAFQATFGGDQDAFVAKLSAAGDSLLYSSYLGGTMNDRSLDMAVDSLGRAYLTGWATSFDFPQVDPLPGAMPGAAAFIAQVNGTGTQLLFSTYLGGSGIDEGQGITIDEASVVYAMGNTDSTDFPTTDTAFQSEYGGGRNDAYVVRLQFPAPLHHYLPLAVR
jgi:hypothetical protein